MSNTNPYSAPQYQQANPYAAINAEQVERLGFIRRTYVHLAGAIILFVVLEWICLVTFHSVLEQIVPRIFGMGWLVILFGFMAVSWLARYWAMSNTSKAMQYAGLGLYVVAQAILFLPLLWIAQTFYGGEIILTAGATTGIIFVGLTIAVMVTRIDFSFLRMALILGGLAAFAFIIAAFFIPGLGMMYKFFCIAMIVLASGYILYDTSNVLRHYRTDQYVAASLALFASVALLFWYVLQLLMILRGR